MAEVFRGFPCVFRVRVVFPFDEIHRFAVDFVHVEDGFHDVFFWSVDFRFWFVSGFDLDGVLRGFQ